MTTLLILWNVAITAALAYLLYRQWRFERLVVQFAQSLGKNKLAEFLKFAAGFLVGAFIVRKIMGGDDNEPQI